MTIDYIFGKGVSGSLPVDNLRFTFSKRTGKIKSIYHNDELLASMRSDGSIAITLHFASILKKRNRLKGNCITVRNGVEDFIALGLSVFSKHIIKCGDNIRRGSEVVILNFKGEIIAVGRAKISSKMMLVFKRGVAVKVRDSFHFIDIMEKDKCLRI